MKTPLNYSVPFKTKRAENLPLRSPLIGPFFFRFQQNVVKTRIWPFIVLITPSVSDFRIKVAFLMSAVEIVWILRYEALKGFVMLYFFLIELLQINVVSSKMVYDDFSTLKRYFSGSKSWFFTVKIQCFCYFIVTVKLLYRWSSKYQGTSGSD